MLTYCRASGLDNHFTSCKDPKVAQDDPEVEPAVPERGPEGVPAGPGLGDVGEAGGGAQQQAAHLVDLGAGGLVDPAQTST